MTSIPESLLTGAAGGVAGEAVKLVWSVAGAPLLERYFKRHGPEAAKRAESNASEFLIKLSLRLDTLEEAMRDVGPDAMRQSLSDPDFALTLRTALLSAARTGDSTKHAALANAVADRLTAAPESMQAMASNMAIEAVHRLSLDQLRLLAVLGLSWVMGSYHDELAFGRPDPISPDDARKHIDALTGVLNQIPAGYTLVGVELSHLIAAGCLIVRPEAPEAPVPSWGVSDSMRQAWRAFRDAPAGKRFESLWNSGLSICVPSPAGLLVGVAVAKEVTGHAPVLDWEALPSVALAHAKPVWDGHNIDGDFVERMRREIRREEAYERRMSGDTRI